GCTSGGTEADAGTLYPTIVEDVSGNQVIVVYNPGAGLPSTATNTSARISTIEDGRASVACSYTTSPYCPSVAPPPYVCTSWLGICVNTTYQFTWNADAPVPHLYRITNNIRTAEAYGFTYTSAALAPPF